MVIPFTGLEAIVLVTAVCLQCKWSGQQQVVEISETTVRTSKGVHPIKGQFFQRMAEDCVARCALQLAP